MYYQVRMRGCGTVNRKHILLEGVVVLGKNFFKCKAKFFQEHQKYFTGGVKGRENTKTFILQSDKQKFSREDHGSGLYYIYFWRRSCGFVIHSYFQRNILSGGRGVCNTFIFSKKYFAGGESRGGRWSMKYSFFLTRNLSRGFTGRWHVIFLKEYFATDSQEFHGFATLQIAQKRWIE